METVDLYRRLTHKYVDSYRHLDERLRVCQLRMTPPKWIRQPESYDDGGTYVMTGRIPRGVSRKIVVRAAEDTFTHWGCHHTHDCCGCRLTRAQARVTGRKLFVTVEVSFNY